MSQACATKSEPRTAFTVDVVNRDTAVVHTLVGTTARRFDYAYNSVNDILAVQRDLGVGDGYRYDLTQQVLEYQQNGSVNLGAGTVTGATVDNTLEFDGCGNRTKLNGVALATPTHLNQPKDAGIASDINGNLQTWNGWTYSYDVQNRLTKATNGGSTTAYFYYDGKNRQIARSINGALPTFSVWDDWELIEEYGTGNVRTAAYLQGAHGPIKSLIGNIYYFYQDELGSTSHIADATGHLLEYYKYDLYGKPTYWNSGGTQISGSNPAYNVRDLFSGERFVPELGLYDLRNRYFLPDLGRFMQPDPIGFKGDASNLYRYCGNDWASRADPMGLQDDLDKIIQRQDGATMQFANQLAADRSRGLTRIGNNPWRQTAGTVEAVKVRGGSAGPSGSNGEYRDASRAPANDSQQPIYLKSERIGKTNDWTITAGHKDKDGDFNPLQGHVAFHEFRKRDDTQTTLGITVGKDISSGWSHQQNNKTVDQLRSSGNGLKGHSQLVYKQRYDVFFKQVGAVGPGLIYAPKTTFEQRYNYNNGAFTGADLIPRE